ncbi:CMP/dCMP deaminase zinc-binding [Penicillium waksmanii]|uniref:CMP/dCMP deaminase zinc-binding n=1 Tax=Penicillium waksmanii TaxID=69791 RepID=UPI002548B7B6|nr:CMP/dCMP deaminase zinc-binding [Penicillium waksmanii]KAJ5984180.1 CMP/dCMP deaminase zinc-binding [Penicillium waksmanii]
MTTTSPHTTYMQKCISLAEQSPPRPTNFRVGAILLSRKDGDSTYSDDRILSTGYTMELAGNTHAEQCCFANYASVNKVAEEQVAEVLPVESGRKLVIGLPGLGTVAGEGIHKVYFGVKEPTTFVGESEGCKMLSAAGIEWEHVPGLEKEILSVAVAGHENPEEEVKSALGKMGTNVDDISEEERQRQAQIPRNPKKRMMENETILY